jgi:hypothetical protein
LAVNANTGAYTADLLQAIDHQGASSITLPDFSVNFDTLTGNTLDTRLTMGIVDDELNVNWLITTEQVSETGLVGGSQEGTANTTTSHTFSTSDGLWGPSQGGDTFSVSDISFSGYANINGSTILSRGENVNLVVTNNGKSIEGVTDSGQLVFAANLTFDAATQQASVDVNLHDVIDFGAADMVNNSKAPSPPLNIGIALTDSDGDYIQSNFASHYISTPIGNSAPTIDPNGAESSSVNEDDLPIVGSDGSGSNIVTGSLNIDLHNEAENSMARFGDGQAYQSQTQSNVIPVPTPPPGLTSNGEPVIYTFNADNTVLTAMAGNRKVFNVSFEFDNATAQWNYQVELLGDLDHQGNPAINLHFTFIVLDQDGDQPNEFENSDAPDYVAPVFTVTVFNDPTGRSYLEGTNGDDNLAAEPLDTDGSILVGLDGNDSLFGSIYDDVLIGNSGANTLTGGGGADKFVIESGSTVTITDLESIDTLVFADLVDIYKNGVLGLEDLQNVTIDNTNGAGGDVTVSYGNGNDTTTLIIQGAGTPNANDITNIQDLISNTGVQTEFT